MTPSISGDITNGFTGTITIGVPGWRQIVGIFSKTSIVGRLRPGT